MVVRPTTEGACQVRLQLSMLLLPITTRANFWEMKFSSLVVFEQLNIDPGHRDGRATYHVDGAPAWFATIKRI